MDVFFSNKSCGLCVVRFLRCWEVWEVLVVFDYFFAGRFEGFLSFRSFWKFSNMLTFGGC